MLRSRRTFLGCSAAGIAAAVTGLPGHSVTASTDPTVHRLIRPRRLQPGDTLGLANPVTTGLRRSEVEQVSGSVEKLGLRVKCGAGVEDCVRDLPVGDRERARELNGLFEDPTVKAILPIRGGWGSARLLPLLDYEAIRRNPKVVMGFSDVAALLLGIYARTGLVTFHGPMGISPWVPFTVQHMKRVLFQGEREIVPDGAERDRPESRFRSLVPGRARGRLFGGNLTVLTSIVGSPYLTAPDGLILFLEEVGESLSEVDRMLTQLRLSGMLDRVRGVVFGQCTGCFLVEDDRRLSLDEVLLDHLGPGGVPAWRGAHIGHVDRQITLPIGIPAEIDASAGTIRLLEPAVR